MMMNLATTEHRLAKPGPLHADLRDYDAVRRAIAFISQNWRSQPEIEAIADAASVTPDELHHLFRRWAGLTPKTGGEGLILRYGFHPSPFGTAVVIASDRGLAGLAFADHGEEQPALADMQRRWPRATYIEDAAGTAEIVPRIFDPKLWREDRPLRVVLIGTDFEVRVWETLLTIPMGRATTYSTIAERILKPTASRAVGAAVGKNPISFVVPCHRVLGKSGALTGYHWGITRKQAMLGWEAGKVAG